MNEMLFHSVAVHACFTLPYTQKGPGFECQRSHVVNGASCNINLYFES